MNTTLSTTSSTASVDVQLHPPQPATRRNPVVRRVGLADRLALHAGLALVMWSRRPQPVSGDPSRAAVLDRLRREQHWQLMRHLNLPYR